MKLSVIKLDGKAAGDVELSEAVFGIADIRGDILARTVNWQLAKRRAGTHKVQTRNENSRTGKKMYKQKGTGGARHGSRRAPQFVGGSRAFGPVVRDHGYSLPKKVRALALAARDLRQAGLDQGSDHRGSGSRNQLRPGRSQHPAHRRPAERRPERL